MKYTYEFDVAAPRESLAVAYARYSSTNQNEMSIETQLANIFRYAAQKKLQATSKNRPKECEREQIQE